MKLWNKTKAKAPPSEDRWKAQKVKPEDRYDDLKKRYDYNRKIYTWPQHPDHPLEEIPEDPQELRTCPRCEQERKEDDFRPGDYLCLECRGIV